MKDISPTDYKDRYVLKDLKDHLEEMQKHDIEYIVHTVCASDRNYQFKHKLILLETREISQKEQDTTSRAKVETYRKLYGVFLDGGSIVSSIGQTIAGQTIAGGLFHVAAEAFSKTSSYREKISTSEIEIYTHRYQRVASNIGDQSQQIQTAEREHEKMSSMIDRLMQTTQRSFELMASSSS